MEFSTPMQLAVELTNRCQFACAHCFRTNNIAAQPDLPVDLYARFLREAQSYHATQIALTGGGEPTLHAEFAAILACTAQAGYTFTISTNGWNFAAMYPLLAEYRAQLAAVIFSLDGATEATHDRIRQAGSYEKVLQACLICHYKQIPFQLTMTVHRGNLSEMAAVIALAAKLGATAVNLGPAQLTPQLVRTGLALTPAERQALHAEIVALTENAPLLVKSGFDFWLPTPCVPCLPLRLQTLQLDYAGRLRFCCQLSGYATASESVAPDVLGDLRVSSLYACHRQMVRVAAQFQETKIGRIEQGSLRDLDKFPCFYCGKYFHKFDWLADFPDSAWAETF